MNISLENYGSSAANPVDASIFTNSEYLTITDNSENYGTIGSGNSQFSADDFDIYISPNAIGGYEGILEVTINEGSSNQWTDYLPLTIEGPNL